jgi:hypothetical protein
MSISVKMTTGALSKARAILLRHLDMENPEVQQAMDAVTADHERARLAEVNLEKQRDEAWAVVRNA